MARFATKRQREIVRNDAGGKAYALPIKEKVATFVLTTMLSGDFYQSDNNKMAEFSKLVRECSINKELEFLAKALVYARNTHGLRSITHLGAAYIGMYDVPWKRAFYRAVVRRVDDVTETLAAWSSVVCDGSAARLAVGTRHPNAMLRGFADALRGFDAYQLAKYRGAGKTVNLYDAVNLCHPKPTEALSMLMKGALASADTWEHRKSGGEQGKAVWFDLLTEGKLGYLACLRNLSNISEEAPDALGLARMLLTDEKKAKKALVFPFQFYTAYKNLLARGHTEAQRIVMDAADVALCNVPKLPGKTLIALDDSGSMQGVTYSSKRKGQTQSPAEIGSLFAATLMKALPDADMSQFSNTARTVRPDTVGMGTLAMAGVFMRDQASRGTNFASVFEHASKAYDRIIILSDMQDWMSDYAYGGRRATGASRALVDYCKQHNCRPVVYSFDLTGNGTTVLGGKLVQLAGFSDKIFDVMRHAEDNFGGMVKEIENVELA